MKMTYLPKTSSEVNQKYYGLLLAGFINLLILMYVHKLYFTNYIGKPELFFLTTLGFLFPSLIKNHYYPINKKKLLNIFPESFEITPDQFLPLARDSKNKEVHLVARKIWILYLIGAYLAGTYFGWLLSIFIYLL
jgi:hypothetical protein